MATIIVSMLSFISNSRDTDLVDDSEAKKLEKMTSKKNGGDYLNG